jgi:hypothetical protein
MRASSEVAENPAVAEIIVLFRSIHSTAMLYGQTVPSICVKRVIGRVPLP